MTKTVKWVLERVRNKGFNDRCEQEKYADIDNQFVFALSVDQALKELEVIHRQEIAKARINEGQRFREAMINHSTPAIYWGKRLDELSGSKEGTGSE